MREVDFRPNGSGPLGLELSNGYLHDLSYIYRSISKTNKESETNVELTQDKE